MKAAKASTSRIHTDCGGMVIDDADSLPPMEDDDSEIWWNYRCTKCNETFRDVGE